MPMSRSRSASLPEGDRGGERDQRQRGGDLPEGEVDRGAHASTSSTGPRSATRPRLEPHHPVAQPPRLGGVVADEDDRDVELAAQLAPASPRSRRGPRRRGPRSARRAAGPRAPGRAPAPASPAAARRPRAWRRRARRTTGRGRRGARQRAASGSLAGEAGGVARGSTRPFPRAAPAAAAPARPRAAAPAGRTRSAAGRGRRSSPRSGSASRLSSRSSVDLPAPEGPTTAVAPAGIAALTESRTRRSPRSRQTSRSSNSTGASSHATAQDACRLRMTAQGRRRDAWKSR